MSTNGHQPKAIDEGEELPFKYMSTVETTTYAISNDVSSASGNMSGSGDDTLAAVGVFRRRSSRCPVVQLQQR